MAVISSSACYGVGFRPARPAMRCVVDGKAAKDRDASPSQMGRFQTQWLAASANLSALASLSGNWIDRALREEPDSEIVLDVDLSVSPPHGEQEQSVWNGHFGCTCYHPLFVFNQFGDLERCALRAGNVHSADNWEAVLKAVVARYKGKTSRICFRGDAAFAMPSMYEYLESEGIEYAIRLPTSIIDRGPTAEELRPNEQILGNFGLAMPKHRSSSRVRRYRKSLCGQM